MWLRNLYKKIFHPFMRPIPPEKAQMYLNITRMLYFFSVTSLGLLCYYTYMNDDVLKEKMEEEKQNDLLMGKPVIEDISPTYKKLREKGVLVATVHEYKHGEGLKKVEYHRDLYLQELEKRAYKKAQEAQKKALEEGKELPKGAIRLV